MQTSCRRLGGLTVDICPSRILCLKFISKSLILFISLCSHLLNLHFKALFLAPRRKMDFGLEPSILFSWLSQPNFFDLAHGSQLHRHMTMWQAAWPGSSCCSGKQKIWFELQAERMGWENKVPQVRFRRSLSVISDSDCPLSTVSTSGGDSGKWPSLNTKLEPCHLHPFFQMRFYLEQVTWYMSICIVTVPRSLCPLLKKHDMEWKVKTLKCIDFF